MVAAAAACACRRPYRGVMEGASLFRDVLMPLRFGFGKGKGAASDGSEAAVACGAVPSYGTAGSAAVAGRGTGQGVPPGCLASWHDTGTIPAGATV